MEIGVDGVPGHAATKTVGQMGFKAVAGVATILIPPAVVKTAAQDRRAAQTSSPVTESAVKLLQDGTTGDLGVHVTVVCSHVGLETRQEQGPVGGDPAPLPIVTASQRKQRTVTWDEPVVMVHFCMVMVMMIAAPNLTNAATGKAIVTAATNVRTTLRLGKEGPVEKITVKTLVCQKGSG